MRASLAIGRIAHKSFKRGNTIGISRLPQRLQTVIVLRSWSDASPRDMAWDEAWFKPTDPTNYLMR